MSGYDSDFKLEVIRYYYKRSTELIEEGYDVDTIPQKVGIETYRKFQDEDGKPDSSTMKRWTSDFRDSNGHFKDDKAEDIFMDLKEDLGDIKEPKETDTDSDEDYDHTYHDKCYVGPPTTDNYYIPVSRRKEPLELTPEEYRKIRVWYSNWTGDEDSINQICRKLGMSRTLFTEIKDKLGFTHDSPPATDEDIEQKPKEELLNDFLKQREGQLEREYQQEVWKKIEKEAENWRKFNQGELNPLKDHLEDDIESYEVPEIQIAESDTNHAYVVLFNDVHVGATADKEETGENFDLEVCKNRNLKLAAQLLEKFNRLGKPEKIYVVVGGDFFHIDKTAGDTNNGQTTYGTLMDIDAHPKKIVGTGFELARDFIDIMRQVGVPMEVIITQGNHDRLLSYAMSEHLKVWEQYQDNVEVHSVLQTRYYTKYKENLLAVAHGDKENKTDLGKIMPREAPQLWADTTSKYYLIGHKHNLQIDDSDPSGVTIIRSSATSPTDRYHKENCFIGSTKAINSFVFYEDGGLPDNINASVK